MKALKIIKDVLLAIAIVLYVTAIVVSVTQTIKYYNSSSSYYSMILSIISSSTTTIVLLFVGVFLAFSKNDTGKKIGNGLLLGAFTMIFIFAILSIASANNTGSSTSSKTKIPTTDAVISLIAYAVILLHYLLSVIMHLLKQTDTKKTELTNNIALIKEWKSLLDENIITPEEFDKKKSEILGLGNEQNENK